MSFLTPLYERREALIAELAELNDALAALRCSFCRTLMTQIQDEIGSGGISGQGFGSRWFEQNYICENCGQKVTLHERIMAEKIRGEWIEERFCKVRVLNPGKPFLVKPSMDTLWIED